MIPRPYIAQWQEQVPWKSFAQIEQDLIISRTLIHLFEDPFLKENLAFRGGTALHKLYLNPAPRYSEDIDLVQIKAGAIKPILQKIKEVVNFFEEDRVVKQKLYNNTILYRFNSEYESIRLRLKLEINCKEHFNTMEWVAFPFSMKNGWFTGNASITTYHVHELLGTKLRALYQRKKGRDLFDLYYADQFLKLDYDQIIYSFSEYMRFSSGKSPSQKQFLLNLEEKRSSPVFRGDMEGLLRPEIVYDQDAAFDWLINSIVGKIK